MFTHLSVKANLRCSCGRRIEAGYFDKVVRLLNVGNLLDRRPISLSGGEKHHVSIGRALLASSQLLLMDEPLASLDSARKDEILHFIKELSEELELPIIYASHAMDKIERLANRLALVSNGKVAAFGSVEELTVYLGLRLMTGRYEAGSAINVKIAGHAHEDGLSRLTLNGGEFAIPQISLPVGEKLRVRIRARNAAIAETEPKNIFINNVLRGNIKKISSEFSALLDVQFNADAPIWTRVSRSSVARLNLVPGKEVFLMIKAVAIDRGSLGGIDRGLREA